MKSNYFLLAFIIMLVFLNCSKESSIDQEVIKEVKVTAAFSGMLPSSQVTTRVTDSNWEKGDAIGLFMINSGVALDQNALESNVKYVTDGGHTFYNPSENKVYYPKNKQNVDFIAYYPYNISLSDLIYDVDISSQINLSDIDLLYSDNVKSVNSSSSSLNLQLTHQLVKVVINLNAGNTGIEIDNFSATITNVNRKAAFSLSKGEITDKNDIGTIAFNVDSNNKTAQAILLPEDDLSDKDLTITIDGTSFSVSLENTVKDNTFKQSNIYTYSIVLREGKGPVLDGLTVTIENWISNEIGNVYADEIPASDDDNPGSGDGGVGEDDNEDIKPDPEDGVLGSKDNPFAVSDVLKMTNEKDIWVKGYIVGSYNSAGGVDFGRPTFLLGSIYNLALADSQTEKKAANTFPVDINVNNDNTLASFLEVLNLEDNPSNLEKEVLLRGDIGDWMPGSQLENKRSAIINLKEVFLAGVEIKK